MADSAIDALDANGRPTASSIRFDMGNGIASYVDPTPLDNSEFAMNSATAPALATIGYDALTVDLHEIEHSMGYSSGSQRFLNLVGPISNDPNAPDQLTVQTSLSGLPNAFNIPIVPGSAHIDGTVDGGLFNDTIVAEPGFDVGQRALPTDVEILGLGTIEGATADQIHLGGSPAAVPEASTTVSFGLLLSLGLGGMVFAAKKKKTAGQSA